MATASCRVRILVLDEEDALADLGQIDRDHEGAFSNLQLRKQRRNQLTAVVEHFGIAPKGEGAQLPQSDRTADGRDASKCRDDLLGTATLDRDTASKQGLAAGWKSVRVMLYRFPPLRDLRRHAITLQPACGSCPCLRPLRRSSIGWCNGLRNGSAACSSVRGSLHAISRTRI